MSVYLHNLIEELQPSLPLAVESVSWDGFRLSLAGKGWGFHTMSPWRLVAGDTMIQGSEEAKTDDLLQTLRGDAIKSLVSAGPPDLDPMFRFRSGPTLQVFSVHSLEPWTFLTPNGTLYAAEPAA